MDKCGKALIEYFELQQSRHHFILAINMKYNLAPAFLLYALHLVNYGWASSSKPEPYCVHNKTEYTFVDVVKTRQVVAPKPWYKKWGKSIVKTEEYVEREAIPKVTPIRACCQGYVMTETKLCEPQCLEGCPRNSKCVEPEICQCLQGYFSSLAKQGGKHYCEPICEKPCPENSLCVRPNECACLGGYRKTEDLQCVPHCPSGCPFDGKCVAPNRCECSEGYKSEKGTCLPICSAGDQCKNGLCVDKEKCDCNIGFVFNEQTQKCEPNLSIFKEMESSTPASEEDESNEKVHEEEQEEDEEHSSEATDIHMGISVDPSQIFDESFESASTENSLHKCPDDFVLYRGQCQPLKFAIDEIDCRIQPCTDPQAVCSVNGTCACREGYKMLKKSMQIADNTTHGEQHLKHVVKPVCLSLEEYQTLMSALPDGSGTSIEMEETESSNIAAIFFIVLGVLTMTGALIYLGLRLSRASSGRMDVEGKQLECAYDSRGCRLSNPEKSVI
ncbi:nimrod C4 [Haematobia irritans]|uniref:nimrod C4 n=1 Tax=Haematobia irritans TaxID=7368 RepID=UPI003F4FD46C